MYFGRMPLSKSYDINHLYGNNLKMEGSHENSIDPIDYVHDKMRKLTEIREIAGKYNSTKPSQRTPIVGISSFPISNSMKGKQDVPFRTKPDPPHSPPRHSTSDDAPDFNQVREHTPVNSLSRDTREQHRPPNPPWKYVDINGYVSDDDPSSNVRWFIKLDTHGDVTDAYKVVRDPLQELRDRAKEKKK